MSEEVSPFDNKFLLVPLLFIITIACLGIGAIGFYDSFRTLNDTPNSDDFVPTEGTVTVSEYNKTEEVYVTEDCNTYEDDEGYEEIECYDETRTDVDIYNFTFGYEYAAEGELYQSDVIDNCGSSAWTDDADRYPAGTSVTVYYDPDDPSTSFIEEKSKWDCSRSGFGWGILFLVIGIGFSGTTAAVVRADFSE